MGCLRDKAIQHAHRSLLRVSRRVRTNDPHESFRLFDKFDNSFFFIDQPQCALRFVEPDQPMLRVESPP
jgi:hypothetical protein